MHQLLPDPGRQAPWLPNWWRRRPRHLPGVIPVEELPEDPSGTFAGWCKPPAVGRLYRLVGDDMPGASGGRRVKVDEVLSYGLRIRDKGLPCTQLLNRVDEVDPGVDRLRAFLPSDVPWRRDDIVATWSDPGSGIGFHSGHEDGFIVQLAGSRRWRTWAPNVLPDVHHLFILGAPDSGDHTPLRRAESEPDLVVDLHPGDALYLPPLWPHEGITLSDSPSLSLSIAWRGINARRLLDGPIGNRASELLSPDWYRLLPDLVPADRDRLVDDIAPLAAQLGVRHEVVHSKVYSLVDWDCGG